MSLVILLWQVNNLKEIHNNCGPIPAEDRAIEELFLALKMIPPSAGVTGYIHNLHIYVANLYGSLYYAKCHYTFAYTGIIHGDLKISSFIFDEEVAIL